MMRTRLGECGALLGAILAVASCNLVTGSADLEIGGDPSLPIPGTNGSQSSGSGTPVTTGAGGAATTSSAGSTTTASSVVSSGAGASTSATVAASASASSGVGGGPVTWPAGPYGVTPGKVVPPDLSWNGYPAQSNQAGAIHIADFYDPGGTKGIDALFVIVSQFNCGPCVEEAQALEGEIAAWQSKGYGIKVLTLIINDPYGGQANTKAAGTWKNQFNLVNVTVAADPDWLFAASQYFGTPQQTIVDPRTMKVIAVEEGYSGDYSQLEGLAASNKAL